MVNILYGICPEGSIIDGLDDWPRSATRKEWFRTTRELVASTIADMDLDPAASTLLTTLIIFLDNVCARMEPLVRKKRLT